MAHSARLQPHPKRVHRRPRATNSRKQEPSVGQVVTLGAWAASATLLFILLDAELRLTDSPHLSAVWHAVPVVGGVAVFSYLERLRDWCLRHCAKRKVKVAAGLTFAALVALTVVKFPVVLMIQPGSRIVVDKAFQPLEPGTTSQTLYLTGLTSHQIAVTEIGPEGDVYSDTIDVSPADMLRLLGGWRRAEVDDFRVGSSRKLSVDTGGAARFVYVSGTAFPEFYLRGIKSVAAVKRNGDTTTVAFQLDGGGGMSPPVRVPMGTYTVRVDSLPCPVSLGRRDSVVTFGFKDESIDFLSGCPLTSEARADQ
jgi:hypothetical protein